MTATITATKQEYIDRVKANFPQELQELAQWVTWRAEPNPGKPKPRKVLFNPLSGDYGSSTDPQSWGTFDVACNAYLKGNYNGLGFVFSDDDPYTGVDFDNCVTGDNIEPQRLLWAQSLKSYTEKSPSNTGLHTIVRGVLPSEGRKNPKLEVEMYDSARYFTVTGNPLDGTPATIHSRQKQLSTLHSEVFPQHYQKTVNAAQSAQSTVNISQDDQDLWNVLFRKTNGESIRKLKDGDMSGYANDHSSADMALCKQLAWVTGNDAARIDRMFRQSALMRPKWDRVDYRERTINSAINSTTSTYDPNYRSGDDNWSGSGNLDDVLMGVQMVANTHQKKNGVLPTVAVKRQAYEATQAAYTDDTDDEGDDIPTSAPQPQQQAQGTQQEAPKPTRSQKIKDLLAGNGWSFRLNILDNAVEVNGERLTDIDESRIITYMRDVAPTKAKVSKDEVRDVFNVMAYDNQFHPIVEYLDGLVWDGKNHVGEISEYITDKHSPIVYSDGRKSRVFPVFLGKWLISAVAKVYERGVIGAQSPMLVLSSNQDSGKSTLVKWLASGMLDYYVSSDIKPDTEDHKRLLASKWIWEVGELGATTGKADVESLKHFLTLSDVTFRVPYGRHHIQKPALSSFIGTVNRDKNQGFLADPTGNRRFLTVELKDFNQDYAEHIDPNQLWAQAVALYRQGVPWRLTEEEKAMRDRINKVNTKREPILDLVLKYFDVDPAKTSWRMPSPDIAEYLIAKEYKGTTKSVQMAVANALRDEGLEKDDTTRPTEWVGIKLK